ncbi:peptidoglycan-recognition protein LC isoform X2 [Musca domestica]|uniref:Peptidoglycan-recognition protein LC isoform X2 n=1 Tax=Musca domestica TaxID=7370 RepID=A0A1I8NFM3_MUSDO|nr:peptidoglycan-recognition protein LC isoform X2 [Musca domestica]
MNYCKKCENPLDEMAYIICGGECAKRFHSICVDLTKDQLALLSSANIKWMCDQCVCRQLYLQSQSLLMPFQQLRPTQSKNVFEKAKVIAEPSALAHLEGANAKMFKRKEYLTFGACMMLTLIIMAAFFVAIQVSVEGKCNLVPGNSEEPRTNIQTNSNSALEIVVRDQWLAQPPIKDMIPLKLPVERIIVIHTRTADCETQAACTFTVRYTQTFNIESQQQDDIIYNFLIGGDGNVYEGRGWDYRGSVIQGYNDDSISLAYIGSFKKQMPSEKQLNVTRLLLAEGVRLGKLSSDYRIVGANKLDPTSTATSADALYESFKDWPHWSDH